MLVQGEAMSTKENLKIEEFKEEMNSYSDESLFNITSFGADLTFRELSTMYDEGELEKPEMQRHYVWSKLEASRFIDSLLLGLPVPSIFLAKTKDNKRLIVDGYQRIMTVNDYMKGIFSGDNKVFKLYNSEIINYRWRGKTFQELSIEQQRAIKTYPIHAIIIEQKAPEDDTGMYQIFERINTGGRTLKAQEIRNCVYHGELNQLLITLNNELVWRRILNSMTPDSRMQDIELILRFLAFKDIKDDSDLKQQINLVKYLNQYMSKHSSLALGESDNIRNDFLMTMNVIYKGLGKNAFRNGKFKNNEFKYTSKINPVIFDAVSVATYKNIKSGKQTTLSEEAYQSLLLNKDFQEVIKHRTTNTTNILDRQQLSYQILFGDNNE